MKTNNLGLYIHIPFCERKCHYCDFVSFSGKNYDDQKKYIDEVIKEIKKRALKDYTVDSIYIGGGTPSILLAVLIEKMIEEIYVNFNILKGLETTIEVNPATVDLEKLKDYKSFGINRISMGVQSFNNNILKGLGRIHSKEEAIKSYALIKEAGFTNVSLDLMYAVPEQSIALWEETLKVAISLDPEHISCYSLSIEEGTKFYESFNTDHLVLPSYDEDKAMYLKANELLSGKGYNRYEISNFSKKGYESKHNLKYWSLEEYLGLGISAHSFINNKRIKNHDTFKDYYKKDKVEETHINSDYDNISEYIFMGLRKTEGFSLKEFEKRFSVSYEGYLKERVKVLKAYEEKGCVLMEGDRIKFTVKGIHDSNKITADLM